MVRILQRYIAYRFIPVLIFITSFFICFLLTFQLFRVVKIITRTDISWFLFLELTFHISLSFLPIALPMACFFSAIYTISSLSYDSEIIAMRSFGLSNFKMFIPFFVIGIFLAVALYSLNQNVIPDSNTLFRNTMRRLGPKSFIRDIQPGQFFFELPNIVLFSEALGDNPNLMKNVFIHITDKDNNQNRIIMARDGYFDKNFSEDNFGISSLKIILNNGTFSVFDLDSGKIKKILFDKYSLPFNKLNSPPSFLTKDSMLPLNKLESSIENSRNVLNSLDNSSSSSTQKSWRKKLNRSLLEYWSRILSPLQVLMFLFLGFSFGHRSARGRIKYSGRRSFLVFISYYIIHFTLFGISKKGFIAPFISMFLPLIIFTVMGVIMFRKLDWLR